MKNSSFAQKFQLILLILLLVTFVMITQQGSNSVFQIGLVAMIFLALLQVAVGNIDLTYNAKKWIFALLKILAIVVAVIGTSMLIVQWFLDRSFVTVFLWVLIVGTVGLFTLFIILGTRKKPGKSAKTAGKGE